jgi:RecB family exonuclease
VHATLEALYRRLAPQGKLEPHDDLPRRALALLEPLWRAALDEAVGASRERLHGVVGVLAPRWLETLRRFVLEDVKELGRASEIEVETTVEAQVEIAVGRRVRLGGRIDRLWKASDGLHVDDFKTSGEVATRLKPAAILKGHHLQLPVYREVAAAARGIGVGAVHARLIGTGPDSDGEPAELSDDELLRRGVLETIAVALALLDAGRFPFRDQDRCVHCEFRRTCRRTHDPSIERREKDPAIADYRDLERKHSKGAYTLAEVRAKAGHEDGESADVEAGGDS